MGAGTRERCYRVALTLAVPAQFIPASSTTTMVLLRTKATPSMSESPSYRNASPLYSKACEYDCLALLLHVKISPAEDRSSALAVASGSEVPCVTLPLKLRLRGHDAWIEDAGGREAVSRTCGFASGQAHEAWLRWIVRTANATLNPNT